MEKGYKYGWLVLVSLIALITVNLDKAGASDELRLTGVVDSVDVMSATVVIDVKSVSCHGPRTFKVDRVGNWGSLTGKKVRFQINSSSCGTDMTKITQFRTVGEK